MTTEFELKLKKLHEQYGNLTLGERKAMKECLKKRYPLTFRKTENLKHDILRLETKRCQLELDPTHYQELAEVEKRVLEKKEAFFKLLNEVKQKESRR